VHARLHPVPAALAAVTGLLGVGLLVAGSMQVIRLDVVTGQPVALPGPNVIAAHQAALPAGALAGHAPTAARTTTPGAPGTTAAPANPVPAKSAQRPAQGTQLPNTIELPKGGTAYLVHGQVGADGALPVPSGVDQAAWWGTGVTAQAGATVFAGHVNWAGRTGPFAELWNDAVGDVVSVKDNSGTVWRFRVTQALTLNKSQLPQQAPALFAPTGPHRIVLATCGGEWVGGAEGYNDNRVLVAVPAT
jgi:Sortase domain